MGQLLYKEISLLENFVRKTVYEDHEQGCSIATEEGIQEVFLHVSKSP